MRHPFITLIIITIPFLAVAVYVFLTVDTSVTIHETGQTETDTLDLTVNPDGSGQSVAANGYGEYSYFDSRTFDYQALVDSIRKAANLYELLIKRPSCAHADASPYTEVVRYNGFTSGDVACITDPSVKGIVDASLQISKKGKGQYPY
jgi:hypothetical protein